MQFQMINEIVFYAIALLVGSLSYVLSWFIEKKLPLLLLVFSVLICIFGAVASLYALGFYLLALPIAVSSLVLSFVKKEGSFFWFFCISLIATAISFLSYMMILSRLPEPNYSDSVAVAFTYCPSLTPLLIWVWKSYRLRLGMDKHLES